MFKRCWIILLIPLLLNLFTIVNAHEVTDEARRRDNLHPDLIEMLHISPYTDQFFEGNGAVDLYGLIYFADDYRTVAKEVLRTRYNALLPYSDRGRVTADWICHVNLTFDDKQAKELSEAYLQRVGSPSLFESRPLTLSAVLDYTPCHYYPIQNCIEQTWEFREELRSIMTENSELMKRYQQLATRNNRVVEDHILSDYIALEHYWLILRIALLNQSEAILAFHDGEIDEGIEHLLSEHHRLSLLYRESSQLKLQTEMIQITVRQAFDQMLDGLLSLGYFDDRLADPKIEALFTPYHQHLKESLLQTLLRESLRELSFKATLLYDDPIDLSDEEYLHALLLKRNSVFYGEISSFSERIERWNRDLDHLAELYPDRVSDENDTPYDEEAFLKHEAYFKARGISLNEVEATLYADLTAEEINQEYLDIVQLLEWLSVEPQLLAIDQLVEENPLFKKYSMFNNYILYLTRLEEQNNYHNLLYLKYRIKRDRISDVEIPQFLESMGDLAKNRITKEPFIWDAKRRTLSTKLDDDQRVRPANIVNNEETHWVIEL